MLNTPGYRPHESLNQYAYKLSDPGHQVRPMRNAIQYSDDESKLLQATPTSLRYINQLFTRPYKGAYRGPGQPSMDNKTLEHVLLVGDTGRISKSCNVSGVSIDRFAYLPAYGNPQRVEHIVPVWTNGGINTRDYVRKQALAQDIFRRNKNIYKSDD